MQWIIKSLFFLLISAREVEQQSDGGAARGQAQGRGAPRQKVHEEKEGKDRVHRQGRSGQSVRGSVFNPFLLPDCKTTFYRIF